MRFVEDLRKRCDSLDIDINGNDISDVIVRNGYTYINKRTGKAGSMREVIERRYILFSCNTSLNDTTGYYVYIDKEYDMVVIIVASYNLRLSKWEEKKRTFMTPGYLQNRYYFARSNTIDICGQTIDSEDEDSIYPALGIQRLREYFGEYVIIKKYGNRVKTLPITSMEQISYWFDLEDQFDKETFKTQKSGRYNLKLHFKNGVLKEDEPIPEEAKAAIHRFEEQFKKNPFIYSMVLRFCILQKFDNYMVQRCFFTYMDCKYPVEDSIIKTVEYERIVVHRHQINIRDIYLIWCDDTRGTQLEYVKEYAQDMTSFLHTEEAKNIEMDFSFFRRKYIMSPLYGVYLLTALSCPVSEKIIKETKEEWVRQDLYHIICSKYNETGSVEYHVIQSLQKTFGEINVNGKNRNEILCCPPHFFETCITIHSRTYDKYHVFLWIKDIFSNNKEFFLRMDKESIEGMVSDYVKLLESKSKWMVGYINNSLNNLVTLYGCHKIKDYIGFLEELKEEEYEKYCDYINNLFLWQLADDNKDGEKDRTLQKIKASGWRKKGKELDESAAAVEMFRNIGLTSSEALNILEGRFGEWEEYVFQDDKFLITYPKTLEEIPAEGVALRHCVKDYLKPVLGGRTNIFFLRKKEAPDKPYFTMEIRDSEIIQIHGFANKNILDDPEIQKFVEKYAKTKDLKYDLVNVCRLMEAPA